MLKRRKRKKHRRRTVRHDSMPGARNGSSKDPAPCSIPSHGRREFAVQSFNEFSSVSHQASGGASFRCDPFPRPKPGTKPNIVSQAAPSRRDQLPTGNIGDNGRLSLAGRANPHWGRTASVSLLRPFSGFGPPFSRRFQGMDGADGRDIDQGSQSPRRRRLGRDPRGADNNC
jgi:hypothetical protein